MWLVGHFEMGRLYCNILDYLGESDMIAIALRERRWETLRRKCAHRKQRSESDRKQGLRDMAGL